MWRQRSGSTLPQVIACCPTSPIHYLHQFDSSAAKSSKNNLLEISHIRRQAILYTYVVSLFTEHFKSNCTQNWIRRVISSFKKIRLWVVSVSVNYLTTHTIIPGLSTLYSNTLVTGRPPHKGSIMLILWLLLLASISYWSNSQLAGDLRLIRLTWRRCNVIYSCHEVMLVLLKAIVKHRHP